MIPRKLFDEEHRLFRDSVRRFFAEEVVPFHDAWEAQRHVDREVWRKAGAMGFLCPALPEKYGGSEADFRYSLILIEEQAYAYASGPGFAVHSDIVAPYIAHYGSDELRRRYLPPMASGDSIAAIAMTEPGTGSDLQNVRTTAVRDGEHYRLNGSKTFITNGFLADVIVVVAKTDPDAASEGVSLLLVESAWEGFSRNPPLQKIGMHAQDTCELFFDDVRVPAGNLLGKEGEGFGYLMQELPQERLLIACSAVATAEQVLHDTLRYTRERKAFGRELFEFQNTRFRLAELHTEVQRARVYVDRCVELHLQRALDVPTAAAIKYSCTDLQCRVVDECLQLHGGYGYIRDFPVARAYADSRVQKIYGGTNEIMKELIARSLKEQAR